MILPDINLLVYAHNDRALQHPKAKEWWEQCLNSPQPVGLSWMTITGFIRLMTHPRVLVNPMPAHEATSVTRGWLQQSCVVILQPGERFSEIFFGYIQELGTAGNLTTDAYLAALAVEHQSQLNSCDADFSRFAGLRWINPLKKHPKVTGAIN